jgi:hypothetical protein
MLRTTKRNLRGNELVNLKAEMPRPHCVKKKIKSIN